MGAVMGSKNLKAIVIEGSAQIPLADPDEMRKLAADGYREVLRQTALPILETAGNDVNGRVVAGKQCITYFQL